MSQPAAVPSHPESWGEFRLIGSLGREGLGTVYRAWQPSVGRFVAVKSLDFSDDETARTRFQREIRSLGRVDHPNVVRILSSGVEGNCLFYAEEFIDGTTLEAVWNELRRLAEHPGKVDWPLWRAALAAACRGTLDRERPVGAGEQPPTAPKKPPALDEASPDRWSYARHVIDLVRQTAEGLHALHEAGVLHRDIKAQNILITFDGERPLLKNLGMACHGGDAQTQITFFSQRLTRYRDFLGTLRYCSPERALAMGEVDRRADIYSLGAVLWEMLTLRPMFDGESLSTEELKRRIFDDAPAAVRQFFPQAPGRIEPIVARCLAKDPDRRHSTALELAEDLQAVVTALDHHGPLHRRWFIATLAATAAAGTLSAIGVKSCGRPSTPVALAEPPRQAFLPTSSASVRFHALAIGVSDYQQKSLKLDLRCARQDALCLGDLFREMASKIGKDPRQHDIRLLLDEQATRGNIAKELDGLRGAVGKGDLVMVSFAGHGRAVEGDDFYFLPSDFQGGSLAAEAVQWQYITGRLGKIAQSALVIVILDACYSGAVFEPDDTRSFEQVPEQDFAVKMAEASQKGMIVFTSSLKSQKSREDPSLGHGLFTLAFLEALRMQPDGDVQWITLEQVAEHVQRRVAELSNKTMRPLQTVFFRGPDLSQIAFPRLPARKCH